MSDKSDKSDKPVIPRSGPRERLLLHGAQPLSDAELVAILLGTGSHQEPVSLAAARLLERAGGLTGLARMGAHALATQTGIGPTKACRVRAALELGRRAMSQPFRVGAPLGCSRDIDRLVRPRLADAPEEHFLALALDAKHRTLAAIEVAVGGLTACVVTPADVFRTLLREAAAAVVFVHNHPSGEPSPSREDVDVTHRLMRAGLLLGIQVLDHVIVGHQGYFSFYDHGLLEPLTSGQAA